MATVGNRDRVSRFRQAFRRVATPSVAGMFARNTIVGTAVFAVDLAILWALVDLGRIPKSTAATIGFVVASTLHYIAGRTWIFTGSSRQVVTGYVYFIINAGIGLAITVAMLAAFMRWTSTNYLVARVIVSLFAGFTTFVLNAVFNFRRL